MAGRGTDILLGGNPEYLAKQDLRNHGVEEADIEKACSFVQDVSDDIKALRERYNELYEKHKAVTDVQKEEVKSGYTEYFIFARSLASLLVDNEAEPETYYSPTAKALFIINAEKFGFSFDFQDCAASGKYVVSKGSSCYSAINRLVSAQYGKSITVTPDGHITVPEGKSVLTLEGDRIISEKRIINRGAPVSQVDYKIASNSSYSHHMKSRSL